MRTVTGLTRTEISGKGADEDEEDESDEDVGPSPSYGARWSVTVIFASSYAFPVKQMPRMVK